LRAHGLQLQGSGHALTACRERAKHFDKVLRAHSCNFEASGWWQNERQWLCTGNLQRAWFYFATEENGWWQTVWQ